MSEEIALAIVDRAHALDAIRDRWAGVAWHYAQNSIGDHIADCWVYARPNTILIDVDDPGAQACTFLQLAAHAPGDVRTLLATLDEERQGFEATLALLREELAAARFAHAERTRLFLAQQVLTQQEYERAEKAERQAERVEVQAAEWQRTAETTSATMEGLLAELGAARVLVIALRGRQDELGACPVCHRTMGPAGGVDHVGDCALLVYDQAAKAREP